MADQSILLFGGGRMGLALLNGWITAGVEAAAISVVDPAPSEALHNLADRVGFRVNAPLAPRSGQAVVVAVCALCILKPHS